MTALSRQQFRAVEDKLHACFSSPDLFAQNAAIPPQRGREQTLWLRVALCVYRRFLGTGGQPLFSVWFGQPCQTVEDACEKIPLGRSSFLHWRERIVLAAALYAAQMDLFQPLPAALSHCSDLHEMLHPKGD